MTSQIKTVLLLGLLTSLMLLMGRALGGQTGLLIAIVFALVMNVGSYWFSDRIVLKMYHAQEVSPHDAPALHNMVEELSAKAGIPKPRIYVIPEEAPNAFATGRNPKHGVVAVTEGIMRLLSPAELRGVIAHEIGHIKNRDILVQSIAGVIGGVIVSVANMLQWGAIFGLGGGRDEEESGGGGGLASSLLMAFLAPIAAMLVQMAISRSREYLADDTGAQLAGDPKALARALEKLGMWSGRIPMHSGNQATAHMFIVNPFSGSTFASLFSTHPPLEERIARLEAMPSNA